MVIYPFRNLFLIKKKPEGLVLGQLGAIQSLKVNLY